MYYTYVVYMRVLCCACSLICVRLFATPWTVARLLCPWVFSGQEYRSGLSCPTPGDIPNPEIELRSPSLQADSLPSEPPGEPVYVCDCDLKT